MFRSLRFSVPLDVAEDVSTVLFELGAVGVEVLEPWMLREPGTEPVPDGRARLTAYASPEAWNPQWIDVLEEIAGERPEITVDTVPDKDWNEVWKAHFSPIEVSERLWVCPSWRLGETPPGARVLVLDPGMAFGTGTHATTALCMRAIDRVLATRPGLDVLDVGTGSGILAIAAKLLGAGRVVGTDNDKAAVGVAKENAELNEVALELSDDPLDKVRGGPFPLVVANIMSHTLIALAPLLVPHVAPKGTLLLSGILDFQADDVATAFAAAGLVEKSRELQGEWILLVFEKT